MLRRMLDVSFNRTREGLRVLEDYARLQLESPALTAQIKNARHSVSALAKKLSAQLTDQNSVNNSGLAVERDITGDCGAEIKTTDELTRANLEAVLIANLNRVTESLRSLAEFAKINDAEIANELEKIRYQAYQWQPRLLADWSRRERLRMARLYVLITAELATADVLTVCRETVAGGADLIQLREKKREDGEFYRIATAAREICAEKCLLIINDRPHLAALANADGVHTGQGDLPPHLTRRIIGQERLIGVSTAAPEFADRAVEAGADYIGVGPVYPTNTKIHRAAVGLEYVQSVSANVKIPYFCIGGIKRENLAAVIAAGASAVAVCTAIIGAKDIAAETAWFKEQLTARRENMTSAT